MFNKKIIYGLIVTVIVIIMGHQIPGQLDMTSDQRFSLSTITKSKLDSVKSPIKIDIFLSGKLPADYLRLRSEIKTLLEVMKNKNNKITYEFIDLFEKESNMQSVISELAEFGLTPEMVYETKNGTVNEFAVFPWAIINNGQRSVRINLLQKNIGDTDEDKIQRSIQQLEYQIVDGLHQIMLKSKKSIAILTSHETSNELKLTDFLQSLTPYYNLASFDLKAADITPKKTLENLSRFDLLIISNPKSPFTLNEKYILDQFTINGGKSLWMVNALSINRDSLFNTSGKTMGFDNELNLEDFFFKYGIRFQKKLVKDLYSAPIVIAQGSENNTNFIPLPWVYSPLPKPDMKHPLSKNIGNVLMQFVSPIDTLNTPLKKKVLINSSDNVKTVGVPVVVNLEEAAIKINPTTFNENKVPLAVLLEGQFESLFKNRIKPFKTTISNDQVNSKMIVVSDGNFAENQLKQGVPLELGYDKWTNNFYSNKEFLINSVHYLNDANDRIGLRSKDVNIAFLDPQKIKSKALYWKAALIFLPLISCVIFGLINQRYRRIKYKH